MFWDVLRIVAALVVALLIYRVAIAAVKATGSGPPDEDGEPVLADVEVRFECTVCGTRVTMTATPDGDVPQAPRHCMEAMALVADPFSE